MNREDYRHYFDALELTIAASPAEVNKAYQLLKDIYSKDSLALLAIPEEISDEQRQGILEEIENAYRVLSELLNRERHSVTALVDQLVADIGEFNGAALKEIRLKLEISLDEVALETKVQREHLKNIEADNFAELPVAVYTRGFLMNYAKFLSLDPQEVAESYMENFRQYRGDNAG